MILQHLLQIKKLGYTISITLYNYKKKLKKIMF